jgi:hypothetical protein
MSNNIVVDVPHKLGAAEARRRIERDVGRLAGHIPGGAVVQSGWEGDCLNLRIGAMGQEAQARIDVGEAVVRVEVSLPAGLSFFNKMLEGVIRRQGTAILEDKRRS